MINFFRKIRKQLAIENKFTKYFRYAFGEVVLIILGIFMALQLQNWNEKRQEENQFKTTLEQLYNTINDDLWYFEFAARNTENQVKTIDDLLNLSTDLNDSELPQSFWFITSATKNSYNSETLSIIDLLKYNSNNEAQTKLARQLQSYASIVKVKNSLNFNPFNSKIEDILLENNIAYPKFNLENQNSGFITDSTYYTKEDISVCKKLLQEKNFRTRLKSKRTQLVIFTLDFRVLYNDAKSMLKIIKQYHPKVKLLFEDVGIIGTSINGFDDVGAHSTPMTLTNEANSIWEIEMYLKVGRVKFRCRDSWAINWGGSSFPKGEASFEGQDIQIPEAGYYKVVLNLTSNTYEFIKLK